MSEIPNNCPGTESGEAGKAQPCQGCPNQVNCSQSVDKLTREAEEIKESLSLIKNIIIIMSGKGGVGKSTFTASFARSLVYFHDKNVGILDLDLCGPSMSCLLGIEGDIHQSSSGYCPVINDDGIQLMSTSFLLKDEKSALIWRGPKKNLLIKNFLMNTDWGELDYLIIDTPPGTSDEHITVGNYLKKMNNVHVIVVSTPQEVCLKDVRKMINFIHKIPLKIFCICQNMSFIRCSNCKNNFSMFPNSKNQNIIEKFPKIFLPFEKSLSILSDRGLNPFSDETFQSSDYFTVMQKLTIECITKFLN